MPMPKIHIRKSLPGEAAIILSKMGELDKNYYKHVMLNQTSGRNYSLIIDNQLMAVGGLAQAWPGRLIAWAIRREDIPFKTWLKIVDEVRDIINAYNQPGTRIEAYVHSERPAFWRFAKRLGFQKESLMKKFHLGDDYYMGVF